MKTIEEHKEELTKYFDCYGTKDEEMIREVVNKTIEFAQRWIPVDEELPEEIESVIMKRADPFRYEILGFRCKGAYYSNETALELTRVTHWRKIELE